VFVAVPGAVPAQLIDAKAGTLENVVDLGVTNIAPFITACTVFVTKKLWCCFLSLLCLLLSLHS
jgi:hypothetical protein